MQVGRWFRHPAMERKVVPLGRTNDTATVVINYPGSLVETYIFIQSKAGAEALWSSNNGTLMPKIAAYRAPCSFLNLE